jgi:hypothetical protein
MGCPTPRTEEEIENVQVASETRIIERGRKDLLDNPYRAG